MSSRSSASGGSRLADVARTAAVGALLVVASIAVWEAVVRIFDVQAYIFPAPGAVWDELLANKSFLWTALLVTVLESLAGLAIAIVVGVALATAIVYFPMLRRVVMPSLVAINATPKVALAPVLILWLGLGIYSKIGMAFLLSFFPIVVNAARGLADVDPEMLDYFRLLRAGRLKTFLKARFPNSLPQMFDGFKIALPIAVVGAVIGEFVASREGIGYQIILAYSSFNTGLVFAAVILIAVASTLLYGALVAVERVLLRWRPPSGHAV